MLQRVVVSYSEVIRWKICWNYLIIHSES